MALDLAVILGPCVKDVGLASPFLGVGIWERSIVLDATRAGAELGPEGTGSSQVHGLIHHPRFIEHIQATRGA